MKLLGDIGSFLWSVINNWAGYCTGGIIVALLWIWSTVKQTTVPRRIGIIVAISFLAVATFNAWREQKKRADDADVARQKAEARFDELTIPKMSADIVGMMDAHMTIGTNNRSLITLVVTVRNLGAPSIAQFKKASITLSGGQEFHPQLMLPTGKDVVLPGGTGVPSITLKEKDRLLDRTMNNPILTGSAVLGWLQCVIPYMQHSELQGATVRLELVDVAGKPFMATKVMGGYDTWQDTFNSANPSAQLGR
jgi:hypothetical protein